MPDEERDRFEQVFNGHYDAVLGYAISRADHVDQAKDAAAQTFLAAWRRRAEFPDPSRGWLLAVTRKALADLRRSGERQRSLGNRLASMERPRAAAGRDDPADAVVERDAVRAALSSLTPVDAEALTLIAWDHLSYADAAKVLGCSRAGFAVRLHRARARFEAAMRTYEISVELPGEARNAAGPLLTAVGPSSLSREGIL